MCTGNVARHSSFPAVVSLQQAAERDPMSAIAYECNVLTLFIAIDPNSLAATRDNERKSSVTQQS
jgi:hypothetical protein